MQVANSHKLSACKKRIITNYNRIQPLRLTFADHEMQPKEYQVLGHSQPLGVEILGHRTTHSDILNIAYAYERRRCNETKRASLLFASSRIGDRVPCQCTVLECIDRYQVNQANHATLTALAGRTKRQAHVQG